MTPAAAPLKRDPVMARLMKLFVPIPLRPRRLPPFQSLTQTIIFQQLSGTAAGTRRGRNPMLVSLSVIVERGSLP